MSTPGWSDGRTGTSGSGWGGRASGAGDSAAGERSARSGRSPSGWGASGDREPSTSGWGAPTGGPGASQAPGGWGAPGDQPGLGSATPGPGGQWIQPPAPPVPAPEARASWGARVLAAWLDGLVVLVVAGLPIGLGITAMLTMTRPEYSGLSNTYGDEPTGTAILLFLLSLLVSGVIALLYAPVTMRRSGQTPGKRLAGIRVVHDDGRPMSFGKALLRETMVKGLLIGGVGGNMCLIPVVLNALWPLWDESDRALHDMIVGTHVLRA